jgi:hypothetical protein
MVISIKSQIRVYTLLVVFAVFPCTALSQPVSDKGAQRAWDALVATKGGREKLHSVRNMVIERYEGDWIQLCVFPDLEWEGFGPFFGTRYSHIFDRRQGLIVKATQDGEVETSSYQSWDWELRGQLVFMLETKWDKPTVLAVSQRKERKKLLDIIETRVGSLKVEFGYEAEELLVRRVYFYEKGGLFRVWAFDGYRSIGGIQMPSKIDEMFGDEYLKGKRFDYAPISFQFDVDYDPKIFQRPLKSTTPDAWKIKPSKSGGF